MSLNNKRIIVWRITQHCNMACQFCSYSYELSRLRRDADAQQVEKFGKKLADYQAASGREVLVSWIGGEPFLWAPLMPLSEKFKKDYNLQLSATTNGLCLLSKNLRSQVVDFFTEIVFSIDGPEEFNDWARKRPGLYNELKTAITSLNDEKVAQNSPLVIKANTILMRKNIDKFEALCESLVSWGVQELTFNQLGGNDRPEFYPDNRLLPQQVQSFMTRLPQIKKDFAVKGLIIHGSDQYLHRFACTSKGISISVDECYPGNWFWFINESGYVSPCSFTTYEYIVDLETIKSPGEIDGLEEIFKPMRRQNRSRFCNDCHCTQLYEKFA